jgi:hypothetical protein
MRPSFKQGLASATVLQSFLPQVTRPAARISAGSKLWKRGDGPAPHASQRCLRRNAGMQNNPPRRSPRGSVQSKESARDQRSETRQSYGRNPTQEKRKRRRSEGSALSRHRHQQQSDAISGDARNNTRRNSEEGPFDSSRDWDELVYRIPAASGRAFAGTGSSWCGLISPNAVRKIPYAASTPNAIEPTAAQTNINIFNKSVIIPASV